MYVEVIYSLLLKFVVNFSFEWKIESDNFKQFVNCMMCYSQYLIEQQKVIILYYVLIYFVCIKGEYVIVEYKSSGVIIKLKYLLFDVVMREVQLEFLVFFYEFLYVKELFNIFV